MSHAAMLGELREAEHQALAYEEQILNFNPDTEARLISLYKRKLSLANNRITSIQKAIDSQLDRYKKVKMAEAKKKAAAASKRTIDTIDSSIESDGEEEEEDEEDHHGDGY